MELGKYRHFKGNDYEIMKVEGGEVYYINLNEHSGFQVGMDFKKSIEEFVGDKVFEKDCEYVGVKYKKGESVKRFVKVE